MRLKDNVKEILSKEDNKAHLAYLVKASYSTVHRWLINDSLKLTMKHVILAIEEITGFSESELFETEKAEVSTDIHKTIDAI